MAEFTRKPMMVLVDEALALYLATFLASPEYTAFCEEIERGVDDRLNEEPNTDDYDDLSSWL